MATEEKGDAYLTSSDIFDFERVDFPVPLNLDCPSNEATSKVDQATSESDAGVRNSGGNLASFQMSGDSLVFGKTEPSTTVTGPTAEGKTMSDMRSTLDQISWMLDDMKGRSLPGLEQRLASRLDKEKEYLRDKLVDAMRLILDKLSSPAAEAKPPPCTVPGETKPSKACTATGDGTPTCTTPETMPKQSETSMSCQFQPSTNSAQHQEIKDALNGIGDQLRDLQAGSLNILLVEMSEKLEKLTVGTGQREEEETQQLQQVLKVKQKVIEEQHRVIEDQQMVLKEKQKLVDEQNEMLMVKQKVVEEQQRLIEIKQGVIENKQRMVEMQETTIQQKQKVVDEQEETLKETQRLIKEKQEIFDKKQNKERGALAVVETVDVYKTHFYTALAQFSRCLQMLSLYEAALGVFVVMSLMYIMYLFTCTGSDPPPKPKSWFSFN